MKVWHQHLNAQKQNFNVYLCRLKVLWVSNFSLFLRISELKTHLVFSAGGHI